MSLQSACATTPRDASHFVVTPRRSGCDRGLLLFHYALIAAVLLVQLVVLPNWMWPVTGLAAVCAGALTIAMHVHKLSRARRREEVSVDASEIVIRRFTLLRPVRETRVGLDGLALTQCEDPMLGCTQLLLNSRGTEIEVGQDLSPGERSEFAAVLTRALRAMGIPVAVRSRPAQATFSLRTTAG